MATLRPTTTTGDPVFLDAARNLADYMLRRLPPDHVPFWDFDSPLIPNDVRDSSAGAIFAAGLLKLADVETDAAAAKPWRSAAETIVQSLWQSYTSRGTAEQSILIHATRHKPAGSPPGPDLRRLLLRRSPDAAAGVAPENPHLAGRGRVGASVQANKEHGRRSEDARALSVSSGDAGS